MHILHQVCRAIASGFNVHQIFVHRIHALVTYVLIIVAERIIVALIFAKQLLALALYAVQTLAVETDAF